MNLMRIIRFFRGLSLFAPAVAAAGILSGCGDAAPPEPLPLSEAPAAVDTAFKDATPEARALAAEVKAAAQSSDSPRAFVELQAMQSRPDLTPEQREVVARSLAGAAEELNAAAARGDARAQQILNLHRARK